MKKASHRVMPWYDFLLLLLSCPSRAFQHSFTLDWHRQVWNQSREEKSTRIISNVDFRGCSTIFNSLKLSSEVVNKYRPICHLPNTRSSQPRSRPKPLLISREMPTAPLSTFVHMASLKMDQLHSRSDPIADHLSTKQNVFPKTLSL